MKAPVSAKLKFDQFICKETHSPWNTFTCCTNVLTSSQSSTRTQFTMDEQSRFTDNMCVCVHVLIARGNNPHGINL